MASPPFNLHVFSWNEVKHIVKWYFIIYGSYFVQCLFMFLSIFQLDCFCFF